MINTNQRQIIQVIVQGFKLVEPWEAGRCALFTHGLAAINPYLKDTTNHDEWERGFVHALITDECQVEKIELTEVAEALPVMDVKILPERSFWACAKLIKDKHNLTNEQLAARIGVHVQDLIYSMVSHRINTSNQPETVVRAVS